jgi:ribosomal protein S18 acetylase RimI-like enzyme
MIRIRAMRPSDAGSALRLWNGSPGTTTADTPAEVRRFLRRNPGTSFVALAGRRLVGAVLGGHDGRRGALWHLAVRRGARQRGTGRALAERVAAALAARGIRKINILVLPENRGALRFWRRLGWSRFAVANLSLNLKRLRR